MNNERYILEALQQAVTAAVAASDMPSLATDGVKYVTVATFNIPASQKYLECVYLPNNSSNQYWGNERTYRGAFRLLLHWPINGGGAYTPMEILASIASYFAKGSKFSNAPAYVKIYDNPDFGGMIVNGQEVIFPVTLLYENFQP